MALFNSIFLSDSRREGRL